MKNNALPYLQEPHAASAFELYGSLTPGGSVMVATLSAVFFLRVRPERRKAR